MLLRIYMHFDVLYVYILYNINLIINILTSYCTVLDFIHENKNKTNKSEYNPNAVQ